MIDDHCTNEWALQRCGPWADFERAGVAKLQADTADHEVYTISDAQLAEWKQAAEPVVKAWGDSVRKGGGDPDAILKDLEGDARQVQFGLLIASLTRPASTDADASQ